MVTTVHQVITAISGHLLVLVREVYRLGEVERFLKPNSKIWSIRYFVDAVKLNIISTIALSSVTVPNTLCSLFNVNLVYNLQD